MHKHGLCLHTTSSSQMLSCNHSRKTCDPSHAFIVRTCRQTVIFSRVNFKIYRVCHSGSTNKGCAFHSYQDRLPTIHFGYLVLRSDSVATRSPIGHPIRQRSMVHISFLESISGVNGHKVNVSIARQSERTIQILEDFLRACMLDFGGN